MENDEIKEILMANHIMLRRLNDVLMLMLKNINEDDANVLAEMHEEGVFASPDPIWRPNGNEADPED